MPAPNPIETLSEKVIEAEATRPQRPQRPQENAHNLLCITQISYQMAKSAHVVLLKDLIHLITE